MKRYLILLFLIVSMLIGSGYVLVAAEQCCPKTACVCAKGGCCAEGKCACEGECCTKDGCKCMDAKGCVNCSCHGNRLN